MSLLSRRTVVKSERQRRGYEIHVECTFEDSKPSVFGEGSVGRLLWYSPPRKNSLAFSTLS